MNKFHKKNIFTLKIGEWSWTGECVYDYEYEEFVPCGKGTMKVPELGVYRGEVLDGGIFHGKGTFLFSDGEKYEGEWENNRMHGQGSYKYPDGTEYVGEWSNDKFHGNGLFKFPSGNEYVGESSNGEWHGKGTWYYPESDDGPPYSEDVEYVNGEEIVDNE